MAFPDETIAAAKSPVPSTMRAWILGGPGELKLGEKPVPTPKRGEVLVRIDAVAICATDLEIIDHGTPAMIQGGLPFNKNFTPGHEYMGTIAALGPSVDEYQVGERVTVEIHAGCSQCKRCRQGMYTYLPQLRPQLRLRRQGAQSQRIHHRRRLCRIRDQQYQHRHPCAG